MNFAVLTLAALLAGGSARAETFQNLEAVDTNGFSTWAGSFPLTVMGVILNDPGEMLDSTPELHPLEQRRGRLPARWPMASLRAGRPAR